MTMAGMYSTRYFKKNKVDGNAYLCIGDAYHDPKAMCSGTEKTILTSFSDTLDDLRKVRGRKKQWDDWEALK